MHSNGRSKTRAGWPGLGLLAELGLAGSGLTLVAVPASVPAHAAAPPSYTVQGGYTIPEPLTDTPGDPAMGRNWVINRKLGNCLSCHQMPIPEEQFHGETAPALYGVGDLYSAGELRLRIVDPKVLNPQSMMPAFYKTEGLNRVLKGFEGRPILTAQQVEDIIAYLMTLKDTSKAKN
ncbi:sulfur oxidation c-type cytochrome SoxX [Roseospira marina]|uniref:Sulfur oxidation c-type cytochrome SoxX n=1 Tax=Roseospira marina TaxID=140057 RepID=A0A5M6IFE4_9PROT|nr:sulfur oxidation c-type cytochrome SoxX [Roseospira marina]KAA5606657.1 sulfur oxidation c-type cytochrome SoxX [Roseospira marina]MBB4313935.1 sulfur-oxidizing protein SoxX [Roseospira marina]MBB5087097.1 sulfur-oxidizing protein SoxX [Roseospira marina]